MQHEEAIRSKSNIAADGAAMARYRAMDLPSPLACLNAIAVIACVVDAATKCDSQRIIAGRVTATDHLDSAWPIVHCTGRYQ
ncbi:hypothetical protein [Sphingobium algorifonticola]|uniref:hypothetical protein n=1 Tax=Sphingobium algorifonticola TaxID=2008318 RepID=UPI0013E31D06|nr:hypothetical protein [Sphingobium algorifonticola]